ncbi:MAG: hypothetical protein RMA76_41980 [Deltaproteobacteria bacterium]|jgi:hypothetical protein
MTNEHILGLDFGKVIIGAVKGGKADTSFLGSTFERAMATPPTDGAFEAVARLVDAFEGRVWIISKCGESVQNKTLGWLSRWGFYASTGLVKGNVRFCRKRPEKAPICRQLGVTHFVDDRLDVLRPMLGVVPNLFLFGEQAEATCPSWAVAVPDWPATVEAVLGAGRSERDDAVTSPVGRPRNAPSPEAKRTP